MTGYVMGRDGHEPQTFMNKKVGSPTEPVFMVLWILLSFSAALKAAENKVVV